MIYRERKELKKTNELSFTTVISETYGLKYLIL